MTTTGTATASVEVRCDPDTAFAVFTADIGAWWKRGTRYWNDPERAVEMRFEPYVGGRFLEVHDPVTGDGFEIGRVQVWEPGRRLVFTWRNDGWQPDERTDVDVRFEAVPGGTRVTIDHSGWDRIPQADADTATGYSRGWTELLGFFAGKVA